MISSSISGPTFEKAAFPIATIMFHCSEEKSVFLFSAIYSFIWETFFQPGSLTKN